jgi:hypothetical protein
MPPSCMDGDKPSQWAHAALGDTALEINPPALHQLRTDVGRAADTVVPAAASRSTLHRRLQRLTGKRDPGCRSTHDSDQGTSIARASVWLKRLNPRNAGVAFCGTPRDSTSTACTTK